MESKTKSPVQANIDQLDMMISVLDNIGAYVYVKDINGCYTYVNQLVLPTRQSLSRRNNRE